MSSELAPYALDPFGPSANPTAYVACRASESAREALARALDAGRVAALLGPPGHGKTLLLRLAGAREEERSRVAYMPVCSFEPAEFFALVLHALGAPREEDPRRGLLALAQRLAARGGVLVLVDDADAMPGATLSALAALLDEAAGALRLAFAAIEGPDAERVCRAFGSRVERLLLADGMSVSEVHRYIEARLAYAGARPELVAAFDEEVVAELHAASQGVPRRVNQLAQEIVRRVSARSVPRLRDKLTRTEPARAVDPAPEREPPSAPQPDADPGTLVAPVAEPFGEAPRDDGGAYRLVRGRSVGRETAASAEVSRQGDAAPRPAPARAVPPAIRGPRREPVPVAELPQRGLERLARRVPALWLGAAAFAIGVAGSVCWGPARQPAPPAAEPPRAAVPAPAQPETRAPAPGERARGPAETPPPSELAARPPAPIGVPIAELPESAPLPESAETPAVEPSAAEPVASAEPIAPAAVTAIAINATPWAVIEIDGREIGETPLAGIEIEEGVHRFRARMPDGSVRDQLIEIRADVRTVVFE